MKTNTFEEHEGVLWKREKDGQVKAIAYCPKCQMAMHKVKHGSLVDEVACSQCKFKAPFKTHRVDVIAAELGGK